MHRSPRLIALTFVLFAACRGSGGDDTPATDGRPIDTPGQNGVTIQEVQNDAMVPGTPVTLTGVVVTAIDTFGDRKGNFFVEEPGGGEFSGILVFQAPVEQVALLAVGDVVDITGAEKTEFALTSDTSGRTTTELQPVSGGTMTVTKTGTGVVPAPQMLDALTIGQMPAAAREAELEKWEGVLVTLNDAKVTRGISPITSSGPDDCTFREFVVTPEYHIDSSLAAIPAMLPMSAECAATTDPNLVTVGDCLTSVTGVGDYFFSYKILPRATSDIVTGGTDCPGPEDTMALCMDTIDNDGNGFTDCDDRACQSFPMCVTTTTVLDIQTGVVPVNANVSVANAVVTGVSFNHKNLWVADADAAAPSHGVYVFRGSSAAILPPEIVVGAHVTVSGTVQEFAGTDGGDSVTEIGFANVTLVPGTPTTPTPIANASVTMLLDPTAGEPFEGVLVELRNVKVTTTLDAASGQRTMTSGTTTFIADDDMFRLTEPNDTCYASLIGVWHYNAFPTDNRYVFLPRGGTYGATLSTDVVTGGTCP